MAKVFLDANYFIGLVNRAKETQTDVVDNHVCCVSILSCHILCYVNKTKIPDKALDSFLDDFIIVDLKEEILQKALHGPTSDLEDNLQLHSAAEAECDYFLTNDRKLLGMKFFGKTRIVQSP